MFHRFAKKIAEWSGSPYAFGAALFIVLSWLASGPFFHWSEAHSLAVNTITTIITFLMVFVIQHAQNSDTKSIHAKLDELLRAIEGAREHPPGVEEDV